MRRAGFSISIVPIIMMTPVMAAVMIPIIGAVAAVVIVFTIVGIHPDRRGLAIVAVGRRRRIIAIRSVTRTCPVTFDRDRNACHGNSRKHEDR